LRLSSRIGPVSSPLTVRPQASFFSPCTLFRPRPVDSTRVSMLLSIPDPITKTFFGWFRSFRFFPGFPPSDHNSLIAHTIRLPGRSYGIFYNRPPHSTFQIPNPREPCALSLRGFRPPPTHAIRICFSGHSSWRNLSTPLPAFSPRTICPGPSIVRYRLPF